MYLSRLILDPHSRQVRSELAHPYEMHRTLMKAFPNGRVQTERIAEDAVGLLFRVDDDTRSGNLQLLVQSQQPPQWVHLASAGYLLPTVVDNPATKQVALRLRAGQVLAFRLLANPTKRLGKSMGKDRGKRVGLYKESEQIEWLRRKGEQHGFELLSVTASHKRRVDDSRHDLKLFSVRFDGILRVADGDKCLLAIHGGIGSGKAFGFGLLSLARVG